LGVTELRQTRDFYQALGWRAAAGADDTVSFEIGDLTIVFRDRGELATDIGALDLACRGGSPMFHHLVESLIDVEMVLAEARGAGATIIQPASGNLQGGYSGTSWTSTATSGTSRPTCIPTGDPAPATPANGADRPAYFRTLASGH
jgi:catechol 2,3-dioxygenase-like lactoylglutathione lyase family enzyme